MYIENAATGFKTDGNPAPDTIYRVTTIMVADQSVLAAATMYTKRRCCVFTL